MKNQIAILAIATILLSSCGESGAKKVEKSEENANETTTPKTGPGKDLVFKLNETIQLGDYVITVTKIIDNAASPDEFSTPDKGNKFVAIEVLYENRTNDQQLNYNPFDWKLIDSDGYHYEMDMNSVKEPSLHDGTLNPGQKSRGWITFQTTKGAKNFKGQFQPDWLSNENVEVQLFQ